MHVEFLTPSFTYWARTKSTNAWRLELKRVADGRESEDVLALRYEEILQELRMEAFGANPVHKVLAGRHVSAHDDDVSDRCSSRETCRIFR